MTRFIFGLGIRQFKLCNWNIFTCKTSLIDKKLSVQNDRVTGNFSFGLIEVTGHEINIFDLFELSISEHSDIKLFLSSFFDLIIAPSQQKVVNSGCEPAEANHQKAKSLSIFQNEDSRHEILIKEERFGHSIEKKRKISWDLYFMLISSIEQFSLLSFFLG